MITDKQLMKVSLVLAVVGLFGLAVIAYYIEPPEVSIASISDTYLGKVVGVKGVVSGISKSADIQEKETLFFTLTDSTGRIKVVNFNNKIDLKDGSIVSVIGKLSFYENKYEIIAQYITQI